MDKAESPINVTRNLRLALAKSLIIPALLLVFFGVAPRWLDSQMHSSARHGIEKNANYSPAEKQAHLSALEQLNFEQVSLHDLPEQAKLHAMLVREGVSGQFARLRWGGRLSAVLLVALALGAGGVLLLNRLARPSQEDLIRCFRRGWRITIAIGLLKVFLLIPLLAYGTFEFTVLLMNRFYPMLLVAIVVGGAYALWTSARILIKSVPMEFAEDMARALKPGEAPELWQAVRDAAALLRTAPPDHILVGLQLNFYVTELAVRVGADRVEGRTLYLSYPLLKNLTTEEVAAIIGHELGHFIGADTRMTREFYPLRLKLQGTTVALAQSGWVGWPSVQFISFFWWVFSQTEQEFSRARELLADQKGAELASPSAIAHALVKLQVLTEAFAEGLQEAVRGQGQNPLDVPLQTIVRDKLMGRAEFWPQLFEKHLPHPLDSHPSLAIRLAALKQNFNVADAQAIVLTESTSAYAAWLSNHEGLFADLNRTANEALDKMRSRNRIAEADYQTEAGRQLLDQHFPEMKWRTKTAGFVLCLMLFGLLFVGCICVVVFAPGIAVRTGFGLFGLLWGRVTYGYWQQHRQGVLTLNAGGLFYSGWKRPLLFTNVANVTIMRHDNSNITLTFNLKAKQPCIWKYALLPFSRKSVGYSLSNLQGKPLVVAETIFRYLTRQVEEPEPRPQSEEPCPHAKA